MLSVREIHPGTPIISVLYHKFPKMEHPDLRSWQLSMRKHQPPNTSLGGLADERTCRLLLKYLKLNTKLLPPNTKPKKYPAEENFKHSILLPTGPISNKILAELNEDRGCVICGSPCKRYCSQCQCVQYCGRGASLWKAMSWFHS